MTPPLIIGHRGAAGLAPENTLASFREAVRLGAGVELDVRLSRDGVPVCFHDDRLERVTTERGPLAERDAAALLALPVMPWAFGGAFPDARIPDLASALREIPPDLLLLVELKPDPERAEALVRSTLEVLRSDPHRVRVISFDPEVLLRVRAAAPGLPVGVLMSARDAGEALLRAEALAAEAIHLPAASAGPARIASIQAAGFRVNAWTVNTPEEIRRLAGAGADEITTDFPDLAAALAQPPPAAEEGE